MEVEHDKVDEHPDVQGNALELTSKIASLENKVAELEIMYSSMLTTSKYLKNSVQKYNDKIMTERQSWDMLETLLQHGGSAIEILDHVKIFFNFLLAKMEYSHKTLIKDIKMLWYLFDKDVTKDAYRRSLTSFGFQTTDEKSIQLLLCMVYKRQIDLEHVTGSSQFTDSNKENDRKNFDECFKTLGEKCVIVKEGVVNDDGDDSATDVTEQTRTFSADDINLEDKENKVNDATKNTMSNLSMTKKLTRSTRKPDIDEKLSKTLAAWCVDDNMRHVVNKMIQIVIYTLNVGRMDKNLAIFDQKDV